MIRKHPLFFASALAMLTLVSCATLEQFAKKPEVVLQKVTFQDPSLFQVTPVFHFKVTNPNPIAIPLGGASYRVNINGRRLADGELGGNAYLGASKSIVLQISPTIDYMDMFNSVAEFVQAGKASYELVGNLPAGPFNLPLSAKGTMAIPNIPDIRIKSAAVRKLSLTGASLLFDVEMENPNGFPVNLSGLDYNIRLGENDVARGAGVKSQTLLGNDITRLQIPVDIDFFKMGSAVAGLLSRQNASYRFSGDMKFDLPGTGQKKVPFNRSGRIPLIR